MHSDIKDGKVETIRPYVLAPWDARLHMVVVTDASVAKEMLEWTGGIRVSTSTSARKGMVGMGGVMNDGRHS